MGTNGYTNTYSFVKEYVSNISEGDEFNCQTTITINNSVLYVDGIEIDNNTIINEIGYHTLTITGENGYSKTINFTILPNYSYLNYLDSDEYVVSFSINDINSNLCSESVYQNLYIDSISYTNGSLYNEVGNHTFTIVGSNGYTYTYEFTVNAYTSVSDNGEYNTKIIINSLNANMTLDGSEITEDTVVSNGTHTLVITGSNGYSVTITFTYNNPNYTYAMVYGIVIIIAGITSILFVLMRRRRHYKYGR